MLPSGPFELDLSHPLTEGLLNCWPLAGDGRDYCGNATLTAGGLTLPSTTVSNYGPCEVFAGGTAASGTQLKSAVNIHVGSAFTISGLINGAGGGGGYSRILTVNYQDAFYLGGDGPDTSFLFIVNSPGASGPTAPWIANTWVHVVGTYDGTTARIYTNGILRNSLAATAPNANEPITLGHLLAGEGGSNFLGKLNGVNYWNRCLSAAEVQRLYLEPFGMLRPVARRYYYKWEPPARISGGILPRRSPQVLPAGPFELDHSHPLTSGLVGFWPLCGDARDYSQTNAHGVMTNVGGINPYTTMTKFGPALMFTDAGGQYNQYGSYIFIGQPPPLDFTGPCSASAWVYGTGANAYSVDGCTIVGKGYRSSAGSTQWALSAGSGHPAFAVFYNGTSYGAISAVTLSPNTWYHLVGIFDGAAWRLYINGALDTTSVTTQGPVHTTASVTIGGVDTAGDVGVGVIQKFAGIISGVGAWNRVLTANEANRLYLEPFGMLRPATRQNYKFVGAPFGLVGPPTATLSVTQASQTLSATGTLPSSPTTAILGPSPTLLLCHADGTNGSSTFIDNSPLAHTLTAVNGVTVSTTSPKIGTGSADFTTGGFSYIDTGNASDFWFGSGPFTIECWAYFVGSPSQAVMASQWTTAAGQRSWYFGVEGTGVKFYFTSDGSPGFVTTWPYSPTLNTWIHLAIQRDTFYNIRAFANGVDLGGGGQNSTSFFNTPVTCKISHGNSFPGRLDEVRISNVARYSGNFTPATTAFTIDYGLNQADQTITATGNVPVIGGLTKTQQNQGTTVTLINIFPGLISWVTATSYTVGQRVGNGGNAYECITAGTSTPGPTGTGSDIVDGTAHWKYLARADFIAFQAAFNSGGIAALAPYPFLADTTVQVWRTGSGAASGNMQWWPSGNSGSTLTITPAPGESFRDNSNIPLYYDVSKGVAFQDNSLDIELDCQVIIDGFQFRGSSSYHYFYTWDSRNYTIRNCIFHDTGGVGTGTIDFDSNFSNIGSSIVNNLMIGMSFPSADSVIVVNNTLVNCRVGGVTSTLRNNIFANPTFNAAATGTADHNVLTTADWSPGAFTDAGGNLYAQSASNIFVDSSIDFRLKSGSPAINMGASLSPVFRTDIFRTTRPQGGGFDAGAYELALSGWFYRSLATGTGDGLSWANARTSLTNMTSVQAGNHIWVADDHAETSSSNLTITLPGTASQPNIVTCVNHTVAIPGTNDFRTSAQITLVNTNAIALTVNGSAYFYGIAFRAGSGVSGAQTLALCTTNGWQYYDACSLQMLSTVNDATGLIRFGASPLPTVLLVHCDGPQDSNTFTDAAGHTLTTFNLAQIKNDAPVKFSGYARFNFTNSYISVSNAVDFNFGAGPFTIEAWCLLDGSLQAATIFQQGGITAHNVGYVFYADVGSSRLVFTYSLGGTAISSILGPCTFAPNTWMHLAVDRDTAGNVRLYQNGAVLSTTSVPGAIYPSTANATIGNFETSQSSPFPGYIDELRVIKGVARYGGAFTAPTAPFPTIDYPVQTATKVVLNNTTLRFGATGQSASLNGVVEWRNTASALSLPTTVLLVHADGTNGSTSFTDDAGHTLTALNGAQVSTTSPMFGTGSADVATSGSYIDTGNATDFNLGSGLFTIEAWIYFTSAPAGGTAGIVSQWANTGSNNSYIFAVDHGTSTLRFYITLNGFTVSSFGGTITRTLNTWMHVAVDLDPGNTARLYVNGTVVASTSLNGVLYPSTLTAKIGHPVYSFTGRIDEIRVTKGVARYGGAFTPPIAPFTMNLALTNLWGGFAQMYYLNCQGVDLSAAAGATLVSASAVPGCVYFDDCKFGAGVTVAATPITPAAEVVVNNSDSVATNYRQEKYSYMGTQTVDTTIVRTGSLSAPVISWKLVTTANAQWIMPFESLLIDRWNTNVGTPVSAYIRGIWNATTLPNNDDIWIEAQYLGNASYPLTSLINSTKINNSAGNAPLAADTSVWNSNVATRQNSQAYNLGDTIKVATNAGRVFFCTTAGTTNSSDPGYVSVVDGGSITDGSAVFRAGVRFRMNVTMTPQMIGSLFLTVKAAKPNSTFWVDPWITSS